MANEGRKQWHIKLINTRTKKFLLDNVGKFQVYTAGAATRVAIFDVAGAAITQETDNVSYASGAMVDGTLNFYTARTITNLDISILTDGGRAYFLDGVTQSQHRVDVDPDQTEWVLTVAFGDKTSSNIVRPLGFAAKAGMLIKDVIVNVKTAFIGAAATANTFDFGRSADANGFINGITLSAIAFKKAIVVSTTGLVAAASQLVGADLMDVLAVATSTATTFFSRKTYLSPANSTSGNLVVQRVSVLTASFTASAARVGNGYVYYLYTLLPAIQTEA